MAAATQPAVHAFDDEDDNGSVFLGVAESVRGYQWRERLSGHGAERARAISQRHDVPELLGRVLAGRDVALDDVDLFLEPTLKALMPDPCSLQGMDLAARRIADAIVAKENIAVFGDYDVDGACSSALMARFFNAHGLTATIYIPDRLREGYGPNTVALEKLIDDGAQLIITVDCGTTSYEPLAAAAKRNTDVIVIDHHQADETLPEVFSVVNPNRQDDLSGQGDLCAAGVVFLVLVAVARELRTRGHYVGDLTEPDLLRELDLVALATVCDVVPLVGLNRAYVRKGLDVMRQRRNPGVRALFDTARLDQAPTTYHLGFILGPRINAGGRIGDSALGARLLTLSDPSKTMPIAEKLDQLNKERKALETRILEEALAVAEQKIDADPDQPIIIVGSEEWHKGVVGLVASRLTDRFLRPSCVLAWTRNAATGNLEGTGSLRSVDGVDIGSAVRAAVAEGLLVKGGGHAMAAGLTVAESRFNDLEVFFAKCLKDAATAARTKASLDIDGALTPAAATDALITMLEKAGPYGPGNPQPRFVFPAHRVKFAKVVGESHVRCTLEATDGSRLNAVAFRAVGQPLGDKLLETGSLPVHVCGTLRRDTWGGRNRVELFIEDIADPRRSN